MTADCEPLQTVQGDERLARVVRLLADGLNPRAVYLFGSRARGDAEADSDYDLLVVTDGPVSYDEAYRPIVGSQVPCDVVPCSVQEWFEARLNTDGFLRSVLNEGVLLYGQP